MNGVFSSGPQVDVAKNLVARLPELSKESKANITIVYELLPQEKTLSVPRNGTAHIRVPLFNVLLIAAWKDEDANKVDVLRRATKELGSIVVQGEKVITEQLEVGYGNYSKQQERTGVESRMLIYLFAGSEDIASPAAGTARSTAKAPGLYAENYARLQKLKKQYDPDLVFFKWNPVTPQE